MTCLRSDSQRKSFMPSDERYLIDLCDGVLGRKSLRAHQLTVPSERSVELLMVSAYYSDLSLAVDVHLDEQRVDPRRRETLARVGVELVVLNRLVFALNDAGRLRRDQVEDEVIVRGCLKDTLRLRSAADL